MTSYIDAVGFGWMGTDFDGTYLSVSDPIQTIVNISAGYQAGYGLVNLKVVYSNNVTTGPLTPYLDDQRWTNMTPCSNGIRFIGSWRQDRYGLTDFQISVNSP